MPRVRRARVGVGIEPVSARTWKREPRPYQIAAVRAVVEELRTHRSTLIVSPTATGKTVMFAMLAQVARGRTLILAQRGHLVRQSAERIREFTDKSTAVEMAENRADARLVPADAVCASVQSMSVRLDRYAPDHFGLIVVDECHHATSSQHVAILDHFATAKIVGVTATPDRLDGKAMRDVFETVAYVYEIRDAMRDGWICPFVQKAVFVDSLDLSTLKTSGGDFTDKAIAAQLETDRALHELATPLLELTVGRPTLVFVPRVETARALATVLNATVPGCAVSASGGTSAFDLERITEDLAEGRVRFLINCALLTEGFDLPAISCVAVARPTKSRALYTQMLGRSFRLAPGKKDALIIDFSGNAGKHTLMCPANVLDGNTDPEIEAEVRKLTDADPEKRVDEALAEAEIIVAERKRRAQFRLQVKANWRASTIDPFGVLGASDRSGKCGGLPATDAQVAALLAKGLSAKDVTGIDQGQAASLLTALLNRSRSGLCTYKMARQLAKHGLRPDVSFDVAHEAIDAIEANGWKPTAALLADPRFGVED